MKTKDVYTELDKLPSKITPAPNAFVYTNASGELIVRVVEHADFIIDEDYIELDETT